MTVLVEGILKNPLGVFIPNTTIRIIAQDLVGDTPTGAVATHTTDTGGNYSFSVVEGKHTAEIMFDDEYILTGSFVVDEFTPSPVTLSELVQYSTPAQTPVVIPEDPDWADLHNDLRTGVNTLTRTDLSQETDGDVLVQERKKLTQNAVIDAAMAEEVITTQSRTTQLTEQTNVYEDGNNNQSLQVSTSGSTETAAIDNSQEVYEASNGKVKVHQKKSITSPTGSVSEHIDFDELEMVNSKLLDWNETKIQDIATVDAEGIRKDITTSIGTKVSANRYEELQEVYRDQDSIQVNAPKVELGSTTQLTSGIHTADIYESQSALVDKDDQLNTTQEKGITAYLKKAFQRITNTGFLSKLVTQVDNYQIQNDAEEVLADFDTVNKTLTINGSLVVGNASQFKGEKGDTIYEVYQYSSDNGVTDPWHFPYVTGDRYRRHATSTNDVVGSYSAGYLLDGKDGADGDTTYVEYQYSDDNVNWHSVFVDGDIWRKERTILNGVPQGLWSDAARIRGSDGADGELTSIAYQYSVDGFDPWHSNFSTGDHYRRERVEYFRTVADKEADLPYQTTAWSSAAQLVPEKGQEYFDGLNQSTIYLYQRASSEPTLPTLDFTYNFTLKQLTDVDLEGWSQSLPTGADALWVTAATASSITTTDVIAANEWVTPTILAEHGSTIFEIYEYSTDGVSGWHTGLTAGDYYRRECSVVDGVAGAWSTAVQIIPIKGLDYDDGEAAVSVYEVHEYSVDGLTAWHAAFADEDMYRRTAVVIGDIQSDWSEPALISGSAILVRLTSSDGFFFKNNTGAVKNIAAEIWINGELSTDYNAYNFHWKVGDDTVYTTATGDYVGITPSAGLYPANGEAEGGLSFSNINIDFTDVPDGQNLNLTCEITNI